MDFIVRGKKIVTDIVSVTYAELAALISTETLIPGQYYKITDYQTVHNIPNAPTTAQTSGTLQIGTQYTINTLLGSDSFRNVGYVSLGVPFIATGTTPSTWASSTEVFSHLYTADVEVLIVFAITTTELAPEAYSETYPQDILYYSFTNDQAVVPGCTKGYIYRRIDTLQNNDFPFDFRNVKFRRWQINPAIWSSGQTYEKGSVVKNPGDDTAWISVADSNADNDLWQQKYWRQFEWDNLTYVSPTSTNWTISDAGLNIVIACSALYQDYKMFAEDSYYTTAYSNKIEMSNGNIIEISNTVIFGANFKYNKIGQAFYENSIAGNFSYNTIDASFNYNSIGPNFTNNFIGYGFNHNSITTDFYYNNIGPDFARNISGTDFNSNYFKINTYYNTFSSICNNNCINGAFFYNSIGPSFSKNNIGFQVSYLDLSDYLGVKMNTFEDNLVFTGKDLSAWGNYLMGDLTCTILKNLTKDIILLYYDGDGVQQKLT